MKHVLSTHRPGSPRPERPKAVIIGAGVNGLTTALALAAAGWRVVVLADRFGGDTVSTVAGAVWEWPPSVCGRHHDEVVVARCAAWATHSYRRFAQLAADPRTGVTLRPAVFYFDRPLDQIPDELAKMTEIDRYVPGFVHDPALIDAHGVDRATGVVDAYSYLAPTVDTDRYLVWLWREAEVGGVSIVRRSIRGTLAQQEDRLRADYGAQLIVNCAGLGARELAGDPTMDPHRGALLRVVNDGSTMPVVTAVHAVANSVDSDDQNMVFIVPRGADRLLLGGLVEPGRYDTDLTLDNYPPLWDMFDRCREFLPILRGAHLDTVDPVRVGLRPFRTGGVRLEAEPGTRIVHNYGHGGAGVTLSWGCAREVVELASTLLTQAVVA